MQLILWHLRQNWNFLQNIKYMYDIIIWKCFYMYIYYFYSESLQWVPCIFTSSVVVIKWATDDYFIIMMLTLAALGIIKHIRVDTPSKQTIRILLYNLKLPIVSFYIYLNGTCYQFETCNVKLIHVVHTVTCHEDYLNKVLRVWIHKNFLSIKPVNVYVIWGKMNLQ